MNELYFGDNLTVIRDHIEDNAIDLVYLDPPFNSAATYNKLFKGPTGDHSHAQIAAFEDTWHWGEQAEREFDELLHQPNTDVAEMMNAIRKFLGENDMMAYLIMMANRLLELHRVLKPTGSLYLHCDPTASHYLKIVLDGIFGARNFRTEISWRRQSAHNDAKQGRKQYGNVRDIIFFYTKGDTWQWTPLYTPYDEKYVKDFYRFVEPGTKRLYQLSDITAPGGSAPEKGNPHYEFLGVTRYWRYSRENMEDLHQKGRIIQSGPGRVPRYKRYLDEMPGVSLQNDWDDINPASGNESLGYQTQKPLALLERVIEASSKVGDVVLDPFCGCGTAIDAAQKLKRGWIGIDVTTLAIELVEQRLRRAHPTVQYKRNGIPKDLDGAIQLAELDKYEFQYWICALLNAQPAQQKKRGADGGIDGIAYFVDDTKQFKKVLVSVKGGENVSVPMIRDLRGVIEREASPIGILVSLADPTRPMIAEALKAGFYAASGEKYPRLQIITVKGLLDGTQRAQYPGAPIGPRSKPVKNRRKTSEQQDLFSDAGGTKVGEVLDMAAIPAANRPRRKNYAAPEPAQTNNRRSQATKRKAG